MLLHSGSGEGGGGIDVEGVSKGQFESVFIDKSFSSLGKFKPESSMSHAACVFTQACIQFARAGENEKK